MTDFQPLQLLCRAPICTPSASAGWYMCHIYVSHTLWMSHTGTAPALSRDRTCKVLPCTSNRSCRTPGAGARNRKDRAAGSPATSKLSLSKEETHQPASISLELVLIPSVAHLQAGKLLGAAPKGCQPATSCTTRRASQPLCYLQWVSKP